MKLQRSSAASSCDRRHRRLTRRTRDMKLISNALVFILAALFSDYPQLSAAPAPTQPTGSNPTSHAEFQKLLAAAQKGDAKAQYAVGWAAEHDTTHDLEGIR